VSNHHVEVVWVEDTNGYESNSVNEYNLSFNAYEKLKQYASDLEDEEYHRG